MAIHCRHRLSALILAAGQSSRMGSYKPLLPLGAGTVIEAALQTFLTAGIRDVIIVVGHRADELQKALRSWPVQTVYNSEHATGMFSSVKTGLAAVPSECGACFLLPCDIPSVQASTVIAMADRLLHSSVDLLYPQFADRKGHPPLLAARLFPSILAWQQPGGLRACLHALQPASEVIAVDDPGILLDIDIPADYRRLQAHWARLMAHSPTMPEASYPIVGEEVVSFGQTPTTAATERATIDTSRRGTGHADCEAEQAAGSPGRTASAVAVSTRGERGATDRSSA